LELSQLIGNDSVVGIDIGSRQIKMVYAEASKGGSQITRVAICPTPPESVREGVVLDVSAVASSLRSLIRSNGIKATNAIGAIAGPGIVVRQVRMPAMSEKMLKKSITFEAGNYLTAVAEGSVVEAEILTPPDADGQMNVMLAAAPKLVVDSRVQVLEEAGLDPLAIDVEVLASIRSLIEYSSDSSLAQRTVALLNIGAGHSEINLVSKGNLEICRTIPISGDSLTNAIQTVHGGTLAEAEALKLGLDLSSLSETPAGSNSDAILRAVQSLIDELLREIRRSVNYYQSQQPEASQDYSVDMVILGGGSAMIKGLANYVTSRLSMEVVIGNPDMAKYMHESAGSAADDIGSALLSVAFGLATKEMPAVPAMRLAVA
jgi:type IV pilus assembly protein PilM